MLFVIGLVIFVASCWLLNWARARNGVARPALARSEIAGGSVVIAIIVGFSVGITLCIMQFTG